MSAKHAVITCEADVVNPHVYNVTITDHSRHGVMVNKKKIPAGKPHELQHEDLVTLPFGMEYRFELVADGCKPITPPPAEPKSAKKTPGKKRTAGEKSAVKSARKSAADDGEAAAKRAKSSPEESRPKALDFALDAEKLDDAKQLEAANAELREKCKTSEGEVVALRDELGRAREEIKSTRDAAVADAAEGGGGGGGTRQGSGGEGGRRGDARVPRRRRRQRWNPTPPPPLLRLRTRLKRRSSARRRGGRRRSDEPKTPRRRRGGRRRARRRRDSRGAKVRGENRRARG